MHGSLLPWTSAHTYTRRTWSYRNSCCRYPNHRVGRAASLRFCLDGELALAGLDCRLGARRQRHAPALGHKYRWVLPAAAIAARLAAHSCRHSLVVFCYAPAGPRAKKAANANEPAITNVVFIPYLPVLCRHAGGLISCAFPLAGITSGNYVPVLFLECQVFRAGKNKRRHQRRRR
jgi:hypothetical protein